jgi:hypothetical protein
MFSANVSWQDASSGRKMDQSPDLAAVMLFQVWLPEWRFALTGLPQLSYAAGLRA